ncbi:YqhG family protein [Aneurinibacillus thermoaerophilus]|uniref:YqhG family protein n=1 Tax=Aneurinibacillus thermoaerophilus TaxID=143495 RepID=UPI002E2298E7|nr:YqhG family protein [Aneurinibacillus thermoaerophilus]MED0735544.1 YqhG family protein [Aneurinibacillus thermoaerophilus]MED0763648.1 YqhG family protein [Aneurinibacillus thermoaerophilus]
MNQAQVRSFLERYFAAHQAHYVEQHPAYFKVELPIEVDKDLGNRPFYWTYVERLNLEPQPMCMTFVFDNASLPEGVNGEDITFGSPRLQQFFASAQRHGRYIRLYEHTDPPNGSNLHFALTPWLGINYKISFICDRKKDRLLSLGINLIHGQIKENFFDYLEARNILPVLPDYAYTMRPIFSIDSAVQHLERHVQTAIDAEDKTWACEARSRLAAELAQIEHFYARKTATEDKNEEPVLNHKEKRAEELRWQYEPRIEVEIINGGVFYLSHTPAPPA